MQNHNFTFKVAVVLTLEALAHNVAAVELSPSPGNLAGNTITISTPDVQSNADPYSNAGNITIANGGKLATFNQFDNTGDYNSNGKFIINLGGQLANSSVFTIDTGATLGNFGIINNNKKRMTNGQYFDNYSTGVFNNNFNTDLTAARTYLLNGNTMTNAGIMMNASDFYNTDLAFVTNGGNWTNLAGSYSINSGGFYNHGAINNAGTFRNDPHYVNPGFGSVENYNAFNNLSGGVAENNDRWYNRITGVINNSGIFNNKITSAFGLKNEGTINNLAGGTFNNATGIGNSGQINNLAGGTFNNTGTIANSGQINNAGTLNINTGASVTGIGNVLGTYTQTAGLTNVSGTLTASNIDIQGGTVIGSGTINGPVLLRLAAVLNPGDALGTLTINGNLTSDAKLIFDIAGLGAGQYDELKINGTALFGSGAVEFNFLPGFNAVSGNSWDFLFADSYSGQNNLSYSFNGLAPGLQGNVSFNANHWSLSVTSVPVPAAVWLLGSGLLGLIGVARRRAV